MTVRIVDPRAHRLREGFPVKHLSTLDGVVLGLLNNSKSNAALLLDLVAERLELRVRLGGIVRAEKQTPTNAAPDGVYGELERECGAVLFASAD